MKYYELDVEQFIDQPVEKVFEFFPGRRTWRRLHYPDWDLPL